MSLTQQGGSFYLSPLNQHLRDTCLLHLDTKLICELQYGQCVWHKCQSPQASTARNKVHI